ncbi:acetyl-CoA acetyltransferase [Ditylenchus destructor]|nr:acetyl-CoA acetyltransferase [Ditylenchus destructor]
MKENPMSDSIVIVSAARTPIGGLLGDFAGLAAWEMGAIAIKAAVERAGIPTDSINEAFMGNCLMAGQGQAPARQAVLKAGLPQSVGAVTLSKMCGAGMRATMFAHDTLKAESADILLAGGMESMTNAPHLMFARKGVKYGVAQMYDHMALDGLEDAYDKGKAMGVFAEQCVDKYAFTREAQDQFAISSTERSKRANEDGSFAWEIAPAMPEKIPTLKPAFKKDGTITAANSSSISDGAAAMVLMRASTAEKLGVKPLARIVARRCTPTRRSGSPPRRSVRCTSCWARHQHRRPGLAAGRFPVQPRHVRGRALRPQDHRSAAPQRRRLRRGHAHQRAGPDAGSAAAAGRARAGCAHRHPVLADGLADAARQLGGLGLRASKAAVNSVMKDVALTLDGRAICVSLHPGWVKTDMGGQEADIDVSTSASSLRGVLDGLKAGDNGGFFDYDGKPLPW